VQLPRVGRCRRRIDLRALVARDTHVRKQKLQASRTVGKS
jgi:hypothetical protein